MPIAILNYRYNYIKKEAVSQNLVNISNGKMYDTPNRTQSPYGESTLFAATILATHSNQSNISFSVPNNLYLTNQTASLQSLQIDLGDGQGYRSTSLGSVLSTNYAANGLKVIKIKVTLSSGTVLQSHTPLVDSLPRAKTGGSRAFLMQCVL